MTEEQIKVYDGIYFLFQLVKDLFLTYQKFPKEIAVSSKSFLKLHQEILEIMSFTGNVEESELSESFILRFNIQVEEVTQLVYIRVFPYDLCSKKSELIQEEDGECFLVTSFYG